MGYELVKVHEVWHFQDSEVGLFTEYVDAWLKIKTEASGWPTGCDTEEEKRDYLERFEEREGIPLEYSKVKPNRGLKATAKLMLNSFWGKFGQRENLPQTEQQAAWEEVQLKQLNRQVWSWTKKVRQPIDVDNDLPSDRTNIFRHEDGLGASPHRKTRHPL